MAKILSVLDRAGGPPPRWRREDPISCLVDTSGDERPQSDRAYRALRARFPTWRQVLEARRSAVERAVRWCGLARQKARAIQSFLRHLKATRGRLSLEDLRRPGLDPDRALADLCRAEGVGVKTAAITLMFACGADLCAVDTHLLRILRRLEIVPKKAGPERAFRLLRPLVPPGRGIELHLRFILLGRSTCRAGRPRCSECPLRRLCPHASRLPTD